MNAFIAPLLASVLLQDPAPEKRAIVVTLHDGSAFRAAPPAERLSLKTPYGAQDIPFKDIRAIRRLSEREVQVVTASSVLPGEVLARECVFETKIGRLKVPWGDIHAIGAGFGGSLLLDEHVVALWSFDGVREDVCRDLVKDRPLTLHDLEPVQLPAAPALRRKSENAYGEAVADKDLDAGGGDLTIEARFRIGSKPSTRGYTMIVSKNDKANERNWDYWLGVQNGSLYLGSASAKGSFTVTTPKSVLKAEEWNTVAVVLQPSKQTITVYVNGKGVHQARQAFEVHSNGSAFYVCAGPQAQKFAAAPEEIQVVRLSRIARTPQEIENLHEGLAGGAPARLRRANKGIELRDGGFLQADFPALEFTTPMGKLTLDAVSGGELTLYRVRRKELEPLAKEAREQVDKLNTAGIEERAEAEVRLLTIGAPAVPALREHAGSAYAEVRARIEQILKKFEERGVLKEHPADVVRLGETVLHGWLDVDEVALETLYGSLRAPLREIRAIRLGPVSQEGRPVATLKSGQKVQGRPREGHVVEIETAFGPLKVPLKEVTELLPAEGGWSLRTAGASIRGKAGSESLRLETPAGDLTIPLADLAEYRLPK